MTAEASFDSVVRSHGDAIARLAWGYVDTHADHDDLVQEILVALWRALPNFRGDASVWTFVFRVAHNRAMSFAAQRRRHEPLSSADHVPDARPTPDALAERISAYEQLARAVRQLPDPQRQAVMLHLEGASVPEIAAVQGTTENNVSVRLTRARQALRRLLGEPGESG